MPPLLPPTPDLEREKWEENIASDIGLEKITLYVLRRDFSHLLLTDKTLRKLPFIAT